MLSAFYACKQLPNFLAAEHTGDPLGTAAIPHPLDRLTAAERRAVQEA
jgi:hypothetical protein